MNAWKQNLVPLTPSVKTRMAATNANVMLDTDIMPRTKMSVTVSRA